MIVRVESPERIGPDAIRLKPIDVARDILYVAPRDLTPSELEEELEVHVPHRLRDVLDGATVVSSIGRNVLIQWADVGPYFSPLGATATTLDSLDAECALLVCEGSGLVLAKKNAVAFVICSQPIALEEFVSLSAEQRGHLFDLSDAREYVMVGSQMTPELRDRLETERAPKFRRFDGKDMARLAGDMARIDPAIDGLEHVYALAVAAAIAHVPQGERQSISV